MPSRRIPHLGHVLLFLLLLTLAFILSEAVVLALSGAFRSSSDALSGLQNQALQLAATTLTYGFALGAAYFIYPHLWGVTFAAGIRWNLAAARRYVFWLIPGGLALGFLAQAVESLVTLPKDLPMDQFFRTPSMVWFLTFFGTLLAPLLEEIVFRGLLLPALSIAVDFSRLPRSLEVRDLWRESDTFSPFALVVSSIVTSLLFAAIHAPQLAYTWAAVSLLAAVSLVLCAVRLRFRSVAASTLVHGAYNLSVFLSVFIASGGYRHLEKT